MYQLQGLYLQNQVTSILFMHSWLYIVFKLHIECFMLSSGIKLMTLVLQAPYSAVWVYLAVMRRVCFCLYICLGYYLASGHHRSSREHPQHFNKLHLSSSAWSWCGVRSFLDSVYLIFKDHIFLLSSFTSHLYVTLMCSQRICCCKCNFPIFLGCDSLCVHPMYGPA